MNGNQPTRALSAADIDHFINQGFVRIDKAFPTTLADEAGAILWRATGCSPDDLSTWTRPVVRLGVYGSEPFVSAANMPVLHRAFDQLVGPGRWRPSRALGTFPVRFPSAEDPATPAGTSTSASAPTIRTSWNGGPTSSRTDGRC